MKQILFRSLKHSCILLCVVLLLGLSSCNKTNQQKKEFIKENLAKTNKDILDGGLFRQKHDPLIIPDFVKDGGFGLDEIE